MEQAPSASKEAAIERWNRRPQVVAQQARIVELRTALGEYVNVVSSFNNPKTWSVQVVDAGTPARNALATTDDTAALKAHDAALCEQVLAQQARIAQMRLAIDAADELAEKHDPELEWGFKQVLATTGGLSALKAHDDALWNEALTTGIEWQATRGHTLDADDYGNELRSLKR